MNTLYRVGGHCFSVVGEELCLAVARIHGFGPFKVQVGDPLFSFVEGVEAPKMQKEFYSFEYEDVIGYFGRTINGFLLVLQPTTEEASYLWCEEGKREVWIAGNCSVRLLRFALWVGYGLMVLPYDTVAIHSSCIVYRDEAVLFLGESGTGKSTHTRLWREHVDACTLLNDDSPVVRVEEGKTWVYGSPWSGKTACHRNERFELKACARLSQAPYNEMKRLSVLQAYGALHPSCPPGFVYDADLYEWVSHFIGQVLKRTSCYQLACLPNREAALLSASTIYGRDLV